MFLPLTTAVVVAVDTAVDRAEADTLGPRTSWLGMDPVHSSQEGIAALRSLQVDNALLHSSQEGIAALHSSGVNIVPGHSSQVGIAAISGTAVGGITALARAGYGRTITASTCGHAIKGDRE